MGTHKSVAVLMAIVMVIAPIAGAAGTVGATASPTEEQAVDDGKVALQTNPSNPDDLPGNFVNATESVDVWDRAIFPLRADRSDEATTATSVDNINTEVRSPDGLPAPLQSDDNQNLVVYPNNATIELSFEIDRAAVSSSRFDNKEVHLIAAKAESSEDPELPSAIDIQTLGNFIQNSSDNENIIFENASTTTVDGGSADFTYDLNETNRGAGTYTFMAVTTANGGIEVTESNDINVPGDATVLGVDSAVVQHTSSEIAVNDTHEVGDTISFDADANLATSEDRVEHTVAIWNESVVADETLTIVPPDNVTDDTTASDFTIEHTIENVAGVQNVEDDVSAFGRTLDQNNRAGVFELADIVSFIAEGGEFGDPETNRVDTTTINASMTSVNTTSAETTIDVETLESFETGEYVAVHLAMADGDLTKVSSERTTITLTEQDGTADPAPDDPFIEEYTLNDPEIATGESVTATVTVRNPTDERITETLSLQENGTELDTQEITVPADGSDETNFATVDLTTSFDTEGSRTLTVSGGQVEPVSRTVNVVPPTERTFEVTSESRLMLLFR
jgi:hypothetical protein